MKILLISISKQWEGRTYREYPYGVGILATLADQAGYMVNILDMAVDMRDCNEVIEDFQPDVIAASFFSPSAQLAKNTIEKIRHVFRGIILAGGIHCTLYPEAVLEFGVDMVLMGEGEQNFVPILDYLRNAISFSEEKLMDIPRVCFRNGQGEIIKTNDCIDSVDLNSLPIMNRNLFDLTLYSHHTILTSRCCPYQCHFCCSWAPGGKPGRVMKAERIILELEWLVAQYGALTLYWGDEIFFWNRVDRLNFCRVLKSKKLPIRFIMQLRADLVDEELVQALISIGCIKICIGAESGSDLLLKCINKKMTADKVERAIRLCTDVGLPCKTWWMVGLPGGGKEEQMKALDIIERTRPNEVAIHQFVPLPGSFFWDNADRYGINLPDQTSFENLTYYCNPSKIAYEYISGEEMYEILRIYEKRLLEMGYVPTDEATEDSQYVFTTPFQKTTFEV